MHQVLQKLEALGRLLKWAIELGKFDLNFCPRTVIKRQALANFIPEFTYADTAEVAGMVDISEAAKVVEAQGEKNSVLTNWDVEHWTLYVDAASNDTGYGACMMLSSLKGHKIHCTLHFSFSALNNEAEYKALITGLCLAKELQTRNIQIYSDSQLVRNQLNDIYLARGDRMAAYLEKVNRLMETFPITSIEVISRSKNMNADALAKLALTKEAKLLDIVSVEFLAESSIKSQLEITKLTREPS